MSAFVDLLNPITQMHKKSAPDYPTAEKGVAIRVYSDLRKLIGPVINSVEKAQDYLNRR